MRSTPIYGFDLVISVVPWRSSSGERRTDHPQSAAGCCVKRSFHDDSRGAVFTESTSADERRWTQMDADGCAKPITERLRGARCCAAEPRDAEGDHVAKHWRAPIHATPRGRGAKHWRAPIRVTPKGRGRWDAGAISWSLWNAIAYPGVRGTWLGDSQRCDLLSTNPQYEHRHVWSLRQRFGARKRRR